MGLQRVLTARSILYTARAIPKRVSSYEVCVNKLSERLHIGNNIDRLAIWMRSKCRCGALTKTEATSVVYRSFESASTVVLQLIEVPTFFCGTGCHATELCARSRTLMIICTLHQQWRAQLILIRDYAPS